jgi:hypothetical protein
MKIATEAEKRAYERTIEANQQVGVAMREEELELEEFKRLWGAANIKAEPYNFKDFDEDEFFKLSASLDSKAVKAAKEQKS